MKLLGVGMIKRLGKNACNDPALLRDAQTLIGAKAFDWAGICGGIATVYHLFGLSCGGVFTGRPDSTGAMTPAGHGSNFDKQSREVHDRHAQY
jgi:hypothetical protein